MRIVDTRGQQCPAPLIATKRALRAVQTGETFLVTTDNQASFRNLRRFLTDNLTEFTVSESEGIWTLTVTKGGSGMLHTSPEELCTPEIPHFATGDFVLAYSSDKMGDGDDDLGHLLMMNFIKAVKDLDKLPHKMVFYNRGVTLVTDNSPIIQNLRELETMNVEILVCATCVNHYSLADKIKIGTLSNMFEIAQVMASAGNVIKP